eukprot:Protomagalhaensia_wolfi_Nauph_80__1237@NODE_172_length_3315_cov_306_166361_g129_i0_p3_GENE_NODE_172_length_3315_cov_306_166361_g129_i0NODE_172_length_3315_cov_306_166361_g129_i0_p3_ORF_typecomplete_len182_score13_81SBP_bac_3/PF00497_20/0_14_NODE_172_length_3315_cov_306_166361_g129_i015632108
MGWCRRRCCCCCAQGELEGEKKTELEVSGNLESPLLQLGDEQAPVKTEVQPEDKQRLKQVVKTFLKDAFEGIKVAHYDENSRQVVPGVFRLDKRVKTFTIAALGSDGTLLSAALSEFGEFKKVDDVPGSPGVYGITFVPEDPQGRQPVTLVLSDAEEQQRFFVSLSIAKHIGERDRAPNNQ